MNNTLINLYIPTCYELKLIKTKSFISHSQYSNIDNFWNYIVLKDDEYNDWNN